MSPVRTCVGCRHQSDKTRLIRLVGQDGVPMADPRQVSPGRGAYLHRQPECWTAALRTRALIRKLGVAPIDTDRLLAELAEVAEQAA